MQIRGGPCILAYAKHFYGAVALVIHEPMKRQYYSAKRWWACRVGCRGLRFEYLRFGPGVYNYSISAHLVAFVTNKPIGRREDIYCMNMLFP